MKHTCKYHPGVQASWYCPDDGVHFCEDCVASDDAADSGRARCFICNKALKQTGRQVAQDPFWKILSHFVQYPMSRDPMVIVMVVAVLCAVAPPNWVGVGIAVALGLPLGVLAAAIVEYSAGARMRPPEYTAVKQQEFYAKGAQFWLLFAGGLIALGYGFFYFGMLKGAGIALLAWFWLTLALLQVVLDGNIAACLAPQRLLNTLAIIGVDYFLAAMFLFATFIGVAIACSVLYDLLPSFIGLPASAVIVGWFFFMTAHLLGYLICQHREKLGYLSPLQDETAMRQRRARKPEDERREAVLLREGKYDKVVSTYKLKLEKKGGSLSLNEQYEKLLTALGRKDDQLEHASRYLDLLMNNQQEYRVVELVRRYRQMDAGFRPASAQSTWDVAKLLAENGEAKVALNILLDLHKRAPTWPGLAEAYLFVASLLKKEFNLAAKAEQYIRFVETRFREPKAQQLAAQCRADLDLKKS